MKKYFVLVSCFVALLVLINVSFAQQATVAATVPCTCDAAVAPAFPFFYHPAPRTFADRLAVRRGQVPVAVAFPPQAFVGQPIPTRRAARTVRIAQPSPVPFSPVVAEADQVPAQIGLPMGSSNRVLQRNHNGARTLNFMSFVITPQSGFYPYLERGYPLPPAR